MSRVLAVAPALPPHVHSQREITAALGPLLAGDGPRAAARVAAMDRLHRASGVETRHLVLPLDEYAGLGEFGRVNDLFVRLGTDLAAQACTDALRAAGLAPADVDFVLFTSVTGVSAPSIDALLVGRLGLRRDVRRLPSFGLGCVGGAAGIARVHDYLVGHPTDVALLVSVELCSLTLQRGDDSMANAVSTGLFGDGAAAVVMVGAAHPRHGTPGTPHPDGPSPAGPEVRATRSHLYPGTEGDLGWQVEASGFRIVLSAGLPDVIARYLADDVAALLEPYDLKPRDVATWVVHAGGPRILDAVAASLDLDAPALDVSRWSLAAVGNLSSASVLHVLAQTIAQGPAPGGDGVLMAFGPGVSAELVLLRWPGGTGEAS